MPSTTRQKLREEMEGLHRNLNWAVVHCGKCIELINGQHPKLEEMFLSMGELAQAQDKLLQGVYGSL